MHKRRQVEILEMPDFGGLLAVEPDRSYCRSPNGMSPQPETGEFPVLNADAVQAWEALAPWWDGTTGDADEFHRRLVIPATDRLLALRPGERVLDVACGNGGYARHRVLHKSDDSFRPP
jgi:hypothetical protein